MPGALRSFFDSLFRRWLKRRQGDDGMRVRLTRRRIYILPTRFGVMFAVIDFTMLLAAMNYSNSMMFALSFLLAALGLVAMHRCHAMLDALTLTALPCAPVFAGDDLHFRFSLRAAGRRPRFGITLARGRGLPGEVADLPGDAPVELALIQPAPTRGLQACGRVSIYSRYPFGLFEAWAWLEPPLEGLVYPTPRGDRPLPDAPARGHESEHRQRAGDDDFAGLRGYRPGDPPRHLAWRALAAGRGLYTKQFEGTVGHGIRLDYAELPTGVPQEARLEQLTRWVLDADAEQRAYALQLPGTATLGPDLGDAHRHRCLRALALFNPGIAA